MDKKIVKAMYTNIVSKDNQSPVLNGVHFEKDRCYATDTKILVVYHKGSSNFDGKTLDLSGTELNGRFPNVDSVMPKTDALNKFGARIDLEQLQKACNWHLRLPESTKNDGVVIEDVCYNLECLQKILNVFQAASELKTATMLKTEKQKPTVIKGKSLEAIIMPMQYSETSVDAERQPEGSAVHSYENFINTFVFEGWKKQPVATEMSWL